MQQRDAVGGWGFWKPGPAGKYLHVVHINTGNTYKTPLCCRQHSLVLHVVHSKTDKAPLCKVPLDWLCTLASFEVDGAASKVDDVPQPSLPVWFLPAREAPPHTHTQV